MSQDLIWSIVELNDYRAIRVFLSKRPFQCFASVFSNKGMIVPPFAVLITWTDILVRNGYCRFPNIKVRHIPKVKIVKNPLLFVHQCIFTMDRPNQW